MNHHTAAVRFLPVAADASPSTGSGPLPQPVRPREKSGGRLAKAFRNALRLPRHLGSYARQSVATTTILLTGAVYAADSAPLHLLTYSGDQSALTALDAEIAAAGTDTGKLAGVEKRLLDALRRSETTFAARQAICQRLGLVLAQSGGNLNSDAAKKFSAMLGDERDSDIARLALEPVAGDPIDALLVSALGKADAVSRQGIIDSLGRRRAVAAVAPLTALLKAPDVKLAAAAAKALGQIGNATALSALRSAPAPVAVAAAEARLVAARQLPARDALATLRDLQSDSRAPAPIRSAALRVSLAIEPATAPTKIADALSGSDAALKPAALEAIADVPGTEIVRVLGQRVNSWDPPVQAAVIAALGRRADPAAIPAVSAAAAHTDAAVRLAALNALGALPGNRDTALLLARAAASTNAEEAKAARQNLARLNGTDVASAILQGAERGEPGLRVTFLEQLALRNMTEGLPLLRQGRQDADPAVRLAAVSALGELAPASEIQNLLDWSIAAADEAEQSRALRSAVNVALRERNVAERGRTICAAIEKAAPDVAGRLLPALPRLGGEPNAACAARLALRPDTKLAAEAVATLGRWNDQTALGSLATVANETAVDSIREAALAAALASFERERSSWTEKSSNVVARLLASTQDAGKKKQLIGLLTRAKDDEALKIVKAQQSDPAVADVAHYTAAVIEANRAGPPKLRASNPANTRNMIDGKASTRWTATANGEEWIEIDFRSPRPLRRITLDQSGRTTDFPEKFEVLVTDDLNHPGTPLVTGKGQRNKTVIELPPGTIGRYVVIKNTQERQEGQWAISELIVD